MVCHNTDIIANMEENLKKEGKLAVDDVKKSIMNLIYTMESILEHQSINIWRCFYFNPIFNNDKTNITSIVNNLISPLKIEMSDDTISCNTDSLDIKNPRKYPTPESYIKFFTQYNTKLLSILDNFDIDKYNESYIAKLVQRSAPSPVQSSTPSSTPIPPKYNTKQIYDILKGKKETNKQKINTILSDNYPHDIRKITLNENQNLLNAINKYPYNINKEKLKQKLIIQSGGSTRKKKKNN